MIKSLTLFISFTFLVSSWAVEYARIQFLGLELLEDEPYASQKPEFIVNGFLLTPDSSEHKIPLTDGFDTISLLLSNGMEIKSITKIRAKELYYIRLNPCSFFELIPAENPKLGIATFDFGNSRDSLIGHFGHMNTEDYDSLAPSISGMCRYSPKGGKITGRENAQVQFSYLFLHGEILSVHFDAFDKAPIIKICGYLNETQSAEDFDRY